VDVELQQFKQFQLKFNKLYNEDHEYRFQVFKDNLKHAAQLGELNPKATFGITKFMDLTPQEFKQYYLISNFTDFKEKTFKDMKALPKQDLRAELPISFDWRDAGIVTDVYNQGQCGSCWAFASTENIESMWAHAGHGLINLAMQQLVDCDKQSDGCGGGSPATAYPYVISQGGIDTLSSYPYTGQNGQCAFQANNVGATISNWGYVTDNDNEEYMGQWLYANGPPSVCVAAETWQYYTGGIIGTSCSGSVDHCVQVVGWTQSSGVNAWTIRNSWGTDWGYAGFCYVEYGCNCCSIGDWCSSSVV